jgi:murein L,D-transpeptidase YcbB/YkuD
LDKVVILAGQMGHGVPQTRFNWFSRLGPVVLAGLLGLVNLPANGASLAQTASQAPPVAATERPAPATIDAVLEQAPTVSAVPATTAPPQPASPPPVFAFTPDQKSLLFQALVEAPSHGLGDYLGRIDQVQALEAEGHVDDSNALLSKLALDYAVAIHAGRLAPQEFRVEWGLRPVAFDPVPGLTSALADNALPAWLASLPPPYSGYQALRRGLARYQDVAASGGWKAVSAGPTLTLGSAGVRVSQLRARLAADDSSVVTGTAPYDAALRAAVQRAQKRYGLAPTGDVGSETLAALNVSLEDRIGQILANMERWRWLPPTMPRDRIQVNVAAAVLSLFKGDAAILSMKAVTGRPGGAETPLLSSQIHSIVLNPPWNVPSGIAAKELWPKERARPGYLAANDFIVIPLEGGGSRIQQRAGPKAALGLYKFDFANSYGVYLHDTPSRGAFERYGRLSSHGCVRVEKPNELAKAVMEGDPNWTPEAIDDAVATGKTQRVKLPSQVAVFLLYWTAFVTADGQVNYRQDPYGWDRDLLLRLGQHST